MSCYCHLASLTFDFRKSILDNANAGGDNVHRGMILGALAGAGSHEIPEDLKNGLKEYKAIKNEIDEFVKIISSKKETV